MPPTIGLAYRKFRDQGCDLYSHVGLGVNAQHTARVLREHGYHVAPLCAANAEELRCLLRKTPRTHVVIEAFWLSRPDLVRILREFHCTQFFVRSHSNVGFLQSEPAAIQGLRDALALQESELNFKVAANSKRLQSFVHGVYNQDCTLLPNLYHVDRVASRPRTHEGRHRLIRIASFGAMRHLKMHVTAAAGALLLARRHGLDLEFHVSVHREEHGAGVLHALRNLFKHLPWAKLVENPWCEWSEFRRLVAHMDLCVQVSATETFNIATADAVAEGVPCIVSTAIDWVPVAWQVDTDDAEQLAKAAWAILRDPDASREGLESLKRYLGCSLEDWRRALDGCGR